MNSVCFSFIGFLLVYCSHHLGIDAIDQEMMLILTTVVMTKPSMQIIQKENSPGSMLV
jgi:hypothetical protein